MKKILAMLMVVCMCIMGGPLQAFAQETANVQVQERSEETSVDQLATARNTDYFTFSENATLDGYKTIVVKPGSGEALKLHVYLKSGSLKVQIKKSTSIFYTTITTWKDIGHHYCDLVSNTDGSTYYVRLQGAAAWFSGGIYSE